MESTNKTRYRVLVSTDLGGDPDDIQSLIHMLHYSDILEIEGIISTAGPGSIPKADNICKWVKHTDLDYLRAKGHEDLMSENEVLKVVKQGEVHAQAPGKGKETEGSRWIIEQANTKDSKDDDRPLWILVWGSMTDIAQALYDDPSIADKIRIYSIGSSNTFNDPASRDYIFSGMKDKWPYLWWIENGFPSKPARETFRGYYQGGEQAGQWGNKEFIKVNIRGRGTGHNGEFDKKLGDVFPVAQWPDGILKEGDTPTFLYLISPIVGSVGNVDDPTCESWGGRFHKPYPYESPNYYTDLDASPEECQATINKWRVAYLEDWKKRWDWYLEE